jgi:hypothetical protein
LHRVGFAWPACRHAAGALLPHHFTLAGDGPHVRARRLGGVISVALSRGFPRVGSPDHPRPAVSGLSSRAGFLPDLPRLPDRPLDGRPLAARWPVPTRPPERAVPSRCRESAQRRAAASAAPCFPAHLHLAAADGTRRRPGGEEALPGAGDNRAERQPPAAGPGPRLADVGPRALLAPLRRLNRP